MERAVHMIERAGGGLVRSRCSDRLPADDAVQPHDADVPLDPLSRDRDALPVHLEPNLAGAIDLEIVFEDAAGRWPQRRIPARSCGQLRGISLLGPIV